METPARARTAAIVNFMLSKVFTEEDWREEVVKKLCLKGVEVRGESVAQ